MREYNLEVIRLEPGSHPGYSPDGCLMEWVALLSGVVKTDRPRCINELVTSVAIHLNDSLDWVARQRLKAFIPQLLRARRSAADGQIGIRLAIWAAASVVDSVPERLRPVHDRALKAAAAHLSGSVDEADCRAAAAAAAEAGAKAGSVALYVAADAAHAACADDPDAGTVNAVAGALQWVLRHGDPLAWFAGFLAEHAAWLDEDVLCSPA
jgi:hypothetical protein